MGTNLKDRVPWLIAYDANSGFEKPRLLAAESKPFQVLSRLHTDVGLQGRYLLNGVDIELRLIRNSNAFCLMAPRDSTYKLKLVGGIPRQIGRAHV